MRRFVLFSALAVALIAPARAQAPASGTLRLYNGPAATLNPILSQSTNENADAAIAFDLLVGVDAHGQFFPQLAAVVPSQQNGGISKDGKTITYKLRRNVKWHDGAPFTSKDVQFSFNAVNNPKNNVISRRGYDLITHVDAPDPQTVVVHLKEPFGPAIATFFSESDQPYRIIPEHLLGKLDDLNKADFNAHPIGTGPFKFVRWNRGDRIEYDANPDYFLGAPKAQHVVVREIPDQNTVVIAFRTHELDFGLLGSAAYRDLRTRPDVHITLVPINAYNAAMFNTSRPPFDDVRVRRAFVMAVDRPGMTEKVTFGTGETANADLPPFLWAANPKAKRWPFDPAAAKKLLDEAGWKPGPDGIRVKDGKRLALTYATLSGSETTRAIDVLIQSQLHDVGAQVEIKPYPQQLFDAPAAEGGPMRSGNFDMAIWSWISGADPDNSSQFTCGARPPNGENFARYCNPKVDAAEAEATSHYDRATRKRAYATIEATLAEDAPMMFLYWSKYRIATSPQLRGFTFNGVTETANIREWSLGGS